MAETRHRDEIGSSRIHITRNNFIIQGLHEGAQLNDILAGSMPSVLACDFMHEITHHWCFTLTVGYAMAILRHRARLALMANPNDEVSISKMLTEEVLLCSTRAALDPLAEGLALYAELDVYPGHASDLPVLGWLQQLFLRSEWEQQVFASKAESLEPALRKNALSQLLNSEAKSLEVAKAMDIAVSRLLNTTRESNAVHRVREDLLSQPLALKGRGHYLLGYMLVKRVARRLRRAIGSLAETGLILDWIMRFFFDDARLVLLLLGKERVENANDIVARIDSRIDALFDEQAIDWFKTFAEDCVGRSGFRDSPELTNSIAPTLGLDPTEAAMARTTISEAYKQLSRSAGVDEFDALAVNWAITMRHMSLLGQLDGHTSVFPSGSIEFNHPNAVILEQGLEGIQPGVDTGAFLFFFSGHFGLCTIVTRNLDVVSIHTPGEPSAEVERLVITPLTSYPACDARLCQLDEWYQKSLGAISPGLVEAVRYQTHTDLERIYRRAALGDAPFSRQQDLSQSMSEAGFFSLLNFDLQSLKNLVDLGLPRAKQVSLDHVLAIKTHGEAIGLPLVEQAEQYPIACF